MISNILIKYGKLANENLMLLIKSMRNYLAKN